MLSLKIPSCVLAAYLVTASLLTATIAASSSPRGGAQAVLGPASQGASGHCPDGGKPPAFILAGDSTTAVQAPDGGGWGTGFLSFLKGPGWGSNHGVNGATTASFVECGEWAAVIRQVERNRDRFDCYVTIQFGHNDQLPSRGVSQAQFRENLENFARDVKAAGGTPIILSPLSRRVFTSEHEAVDTLHDERLLSKAAAAATRTWFLDLGVASLAYIEAIGREAAHRYDSKPGDREHLGVHGSVVFGRMVADLLLGHKPLIERPGRAVDSPSKDGGGEVTKKGLSGAAPTSAHEGPAPWPECLQAWFRSDEELSWKIWHGVEA